VNQRRPANQQRAPGPQPALSQRQLRAIHAQRRTLADHDMLSEPGYRALLAEYPREQRGGDGTPCTSSTHLSRRQARAVITRLGIMGAPVPTPYSGTRAAADATTAAGGTALPTPAQRALIDRLRAEITWRVSYDAWLASRYSPTRGQPVTTYQRAEAVIDALHALRDRQAGSAP
jgi:hypothetical protein